jgi:hypothetical protein
MLSDRWIPGTPMMHPIGCPNQYSKHHGMHSSSHHAIVSTCQAWGYGKIDVRAATGEVHVTLLSTRSQKFGQHNIRGSASTHFQSLVSIKVSQQSVSRVPECPNKVSPRVVPSHRWCPNQVSNQSVGVSNRGGWWCPNKVSNQSVGVSNQRVCAERHAAPKPLTSSPSPLLPTHRNAATAAAIHAYQNSACGMSVVHLP